MAKEKYAIKEEIDLQDTIIMKMKQEKQQIKMGSCIVGILDKLIKTEIYTLQED